MQSTVKFWVYHTEGPVKIKLRAGQVVRHYQASQHDEGWSSECNRYEFDGEFVHCRTETDGVDCDGRLSASQEAHFRAARAAKGHHSDEFGVTYPDWQRGEYRQRDYSAEAAGY